MTRSYSGLGFTTSAFPRGLGVARNAPQAGGYTHLAAAPFNEIEYWIAPGRIPGHLHGLGDTTQLIMSAPSIAGGVLTTGGASSLAATLWGTAAIPVIGAVVAGVTFALMLLLTRKGPKQKTATTHIVDMIENGFYADDGQHHPGLKDNLIGYFQGPRTASSRAQALANFEAGWGFVVAHCNTAEMGDPGQRCVQDRQAGACKWTRGAGDPMEQYDGIQAGGCFNWWSAYHDPIFRDIPNPDPSIVSETGSVLISIFGGSGNTSTYLLAGGALLLLAAFMGGSK